jgi:hypothetical protein
MHYADHKTKLNTENIQTLSIHLTLCQLKMSHPVTGHVAVMQDANGVPMYDNKTLHMEVSDLLPNTLYNSILY